MKNFRITVGGLGGEIYIHKLDLETYDKFDELGEITSDEIDELGIEDIFDSEEIVSGAYNDPECYVIEVFEGENLIWSSLENNDVIDDGFYETQYCGEYLLCEDYIKGPNFFSCELTTEEFDPTKLKTVITDVGEMRELITNLMYDNITLERNYDESEFWSKGLSYFLSLN